MRPVFSMSLTKLNCFAMGGKIHWRRRSGRRSYLLMKWLRLRSDGNLPKSALFQTIRRFSSSRFLAAAFLMETIGMAIAAYERTLLLANSRFRPLALRRAKRAPCRSKSS